MSGLYRRNNSKVWWVRFQHNGKRYQKSSKTTNQAEATKFLLQYQDEVQRFSRSGSRRYNFEEMANRFAVDHLPLLKPKTALGYRTHIRSFANHFSGLYLDQISKAKIADYISLKRKEGLSTASIRRHLATLSSMFSRAIGWDWTDKNPARDFDKKSVPEAKARTRYLTKEEFNRLLDHSANHLKPILLIAVHTGMRSEELLSLQWNQINLERREITLHKTKSGLPRVIPLSPIAVSTFVAIPRHITSAYVFCDRVTGERYRSLKTAFRSACRRANITNFRFHDLRHTFASWQVQNGMDLYRLSRILGHSTIQMTSKYAHLATADLHDAMNTAATKMATREEDSKPTSHHFEQSET
jgi:integrase/recombinase XerD